MEKAPFPIAIDSTMVSAFRSCPTKFRREYVEHWRSKEPSIHLHAGGAFAKGLEVTRRAFYEEGLSASEARQKGAAALRASYSDFETHEKDTKTLPRMLGALDFYFENYPLEHDAATPLKLASGKRAIEWTFAIPLPLAHPESGDPLIYYGRCDMVADFAGGIYIVDEKTTSSLGSSWARGWTLAGQPTGYIWAAQKTGLDVRGAIIRGISILKTKYETQQVILHRSAAQIAQWLDQLYWTIDRMIEQWRCNHWEMNLDKACGDYGGCRFLESCEAPNAEEWLRVKFEKRVWSPLHREELPNEQ